MYKNGLNKIQWLNIKPNQTTHTHSQGDTHEYILLY